MFRKNDDHMQCELFNTSSYLNQRVRNRLDGSWAPLFYENVFCMIDESPFAILYADQVGRPNFPVNILLGLEIIAAFKDFTVEEMLEEFFFNLQIKRALGIRDIGECPLAERTIYYFRQRLYLHTLEHPEDTDLVYQQFQIISEHLMNFMGLSGQEMRMDSTMLMSNIRKAGRLSLAYDVLHKALKAIPAEQLPEQLAEVLKPGFKNNLLYRAKFCEIAGRFHEMLQLCGTVLKWVSGDDDLKNHVAVKQVSRFLTDKAEYDTDSKEWVYKTPKPGTTSDHLQSAHDPDATCRKKREEVHIGYVANLTETCSDDNPVQIVTDYTIKKNNVADQTMAHESIPRLVSVYGMEELYVDGGYSGEAVHNTAADQGVDMYYTNMTGKESSKTSLNEFTFEGTTVTHCPAGHPSIFSLYDDETSNILAHFDKETCQACPAQLSCPTVPRRQGRTLSITPKQRIAAETRKQIEDKDQHRINTSKRAAIEGTNSAIKRRHGAGKLRVRGHHKCRIIFGLKIMAHNFKQLLRSVKGDIRRSLQEAARQRKRKGLPVAASNV